MRSNAFRAHCLVLLLALCPGWVWASDDAAERHARRRELREHLKVERERWHAERGVFPRPNRPATEGPTEEVSRSPGKSRSARQEAEGRTERPVASSGEAFVAAPSTDPAQRARGPGMRLSADERRDLRHSLRERHAEGRGSDPGSESGSR